LKASHQLFAITVGLCFGVPDLMNLHNVTIWIFDTRQWGREDTTNLTIRVLGPSAFQREVVRWQCGSKIVVGLVEIVGFVVPVL